MNPIGHLNPVEQKLCNKADLKKVPIAGNIELLPLCNMDCRMCFAKMTVKEMEEHHPLIDYKEWIRIGKEMSDAGTLFMLFTGGEPLLYPHFKELYVAYKKMGFVVSVNTNGTLINEEWAQFFAKYPPRRLNITMYGSSDETYARLCNNPKGFSQLINAVHLLKKYNVAVKFNCSLTPYNIDEQEEMYNVAASLDIPMEQGYYMFPPIRKNNINNVKYRLDAKDAAKARFTYEKLKYGDSQLEIYKNGLETYRKHKELPFTNGYFCRSGNSVFWVNYDGTMQACSFTNDCSIDIFETGFQEGWKKLLEHVGRSHMPTKCFSCKEKTLCGICAAACCSETGAVEIHPEYYCELTNEYKRLIEEYVKENDQ